MAAALGKIYAWNLVGQCSGWEWWHTHPHLANRLERLRENPAVI